MRNRERERRLFHPLTCPTPTAHRHTALSKCGFHEVTKEGLVRFFEPDSFCIGRKAGSLWGTCGSVHSTPSTPTATAAPQDPPAEGSALGVLQHCQAQVLQAAGARSHPSIQHRAAGSQFTAGRHSPPFYSTRAPGDAHWPKSECPSSAQTCFLHSPWKAAGVTALPGSLPPHRGPWLQPCPGPAGKVCLREPTGGRALSLFTFSTENINHLFSSVLP